MARNDAADRFVDCVINRGRYDSVTRTSLLITSMLVPVLFGLIMTSYASSNHPDVFDVHTDGAIACAIVASVECGMISFILLFMSRRSKRHMRRDVEWMSSLCDYVDSVGGNSTDMRRISMEADMLTTKINNGASMAIWAFTALYICAIGIMSYHGVATMDTHITAVYAACYALVIVQYLITAGSVSRFPSKHDKLQCEFTEAMSKELRRAGIPAEPMRRCTGNLHPVINTMLFIVTLGLYSVVIIILSNIRFGNHVKGQWKYEEKLMETLMRSQGATGIEGY